MPYLHAWCIVAEARPMVCISVFTETEWSFLPSVGSPLARMRGLLPSMEEGNEDELTGSSSSDGQLTPEEVMSLMQQAVYRPECETNKECLKISVDRPGLFSCGTSEIGPCYQQAWRSTVHQPAQYPSAPCLGEHNEYVYTNLGPLTGIVEYLDQGL